MSSINSPDHDKLIEKLTKEITGEDGSFILNFGSRRKLPETLRMVGVSNTVMVAELYKVVYEKSLNEYVKRYFASVDSSVLKFAAHYHNIIDFMFGTDKHAGVYPMLVKHRVEVEKQLPAIEDVLPATEKMYLEGFRVKERNNKFFLVDPTLTREVELEQYNAAGVVKTNDYLGELMKLLRIGSIDRITSAQSAAAVSFEVPSASERETFAAATDYESALVTLGELNEIDSFALERTKGTEEHVTTVFGGKSWAAVNTSFIGKSTRNYFWLALDYAEFKLVSDLGREHGFMFLTNLPTRYLVDQGGYLVSRVNLLPLGIMVDALNYYPTAMSSAYAWLESMGLETVAQLRGELATFALLQLALGSNEVDYSSFSVDTDTRKVVNHHHSGKSLIKSLAYQSVPNALVNITVGTGKDGQHLMDLEELGKLTELVISRGEMPAKYVELFGFEGGFKLKNVGTDDLLQNVDDLSTMSLPPVLFDDESGVMCSIGKAMYDGECDLYDNWFANHLKSSGVPAYSDIFLVLCNRFALLSMMTFRSTNITL